MRAQTGTRRDTPRSLRAAPAATHYRTQGLGHGKGSGPRPDAIEPIRITPQRAHTRRRTGGFTAAVRHAHARQHRRGLWRHWNQPALRVPQGRIGGNGLRRNRNGGAGDRHAVSHSLGAAARRHRQIRAVAAARRQQRRGRRAGADGAWPALAAKRHDHGGARHYRRGILLWRCAHHAGDFRALRRRGAQARDAHVRALRTAADGGDSGGAIRLPIARNRQGRRAVRPDHSPVVPRYRGGRRRAHFR